jgi:dipeptidyl aminopeptidase/acylaminoacyl peptidase
MRNKAFLFLCLITCIFSTEVFSQGHDTTAKKTDQIKYPQEKHFKSITQLTFGGDNAEAYFSFNNDMLVFQMTNPAKNVACDQIYYSTINNFSPKLVSTGKGRTTCSYFLPGDSLVLFASTHEASDECPPKPAPRADHKYVWPLYDSFDIYVSDLQGKVKKKLTDQPGYDAEATLSPDGKMIVFTSLRSGDLELYTMNVDGTNLKQVTTELGYDGGAFFSPDSKRLIFRASRPKTEEEIKVYKDLLSQGQVMPTNMELYTCNIDGSSLKQITKLGGANWAPYFSADGKKVIFSSNHVKRGFNFNLWMCNDDGTDLEQVTFDSSFDAFPVFSRDGKKLVFSSNRNNKGTHDTNLFIAEWE